VLAPNYLRHALTAIGDAVVGVIGNLALWFAPTTAFHTVTPINWGPLRVAIPEWSPAVWRSIAITALAAVIVSRFDVGTLRVLAVCAAAGVGAAAAGLA
jgi:chromate transporter